MEDNCNLLFVSAVQQHRSAIIIYICPLPLEIPSHLPLHSTLLGCHRVQIQISRVFYGNVYVSLVTQLCPTLWDPMDCSLPGSSVHGIFQARILEWIATSFSRGSSQPRDWTQVSHTAGRLFTVWATRKAIPAIWPNNSPRNLPKRNENLDSHTKTKPHTKFCSSRIHDHKN